MNLRFAVIHYGARLHYMAPAAMAQTGHLHRLYTDFCILPAEGRWLSKLPVQILPPPLRRALGRRIPDEIPRSAIRRFAASTFRDHYYFRRHPEVARSAEASYEKHTAGHALSDRLLERDFDGANALYVHPCDATRAIEEAHRRGLPVLYEAIGHPRDEFISAAEYERHGIDPSPFYNRREMEVKLSWFLKEAGLSTLVLAASNYSKVGLLEAGVPEEKICVVPYGLPLNFFDQPPSPVKGRVLFVGTVGYRKGLPDLAAAARLLQKSHPGIEVRVVGPFEFDLVGRPEFEGLTYLGQIPRAEVKKEYLSADLFVFPTLSDAFGIVLMEAMAAGLPIVATPNCADAVEDGSNGFRVPVHNPEAIAMRIAQIVEDRALRASMGRESLEMFSYFSPDAYSQRLAAAIERAGALHKTGISCSSSAGRV